MEYVMSYQTALGISALFTGILLVTAFIVVKLKDKTQPAEVQKR